MTLRVDDPSTIWISGSLTSRKLVLLICVFLPQCYLSSIKEYEGFISVQISAYNRQI